MDGNLPKQVLVEWAERGRNHRHECPTEHVLVHGAASTSYEEFTSLVQATAPEYW